jgi:hypothetical protein
MKSNEFSSEREAIVLQHVRELATDLRYVDVADYVAFVRCDRLGNIADIVNSAAELFFYPETLRFGHGGEVELSWDTPPKVALDLEFSNLGVNVYFQLVLHGDRMQVDLRHVTFSEPELDTNDNTALLARAFAHARMPRRSELLKRQHSAPSSAGIGNTV